MNTFTELPVSFTMALYALTKKGTNFNFDSYVSNLTLQFQNCFKKMNFNTSTCQCIYSR